MTRVSLVKNIFAGLCTGMQSAGCVCCAELLIIRVTVNGAGNILCQRAEFHFTFLQLFLDPGHKSHHEVQWALLS